MLQAGSQTSSVLMPPGYYSGDLGEWKTLPWPDEQGEKIELLENSLGPALIDWAEWRTDEPGLLNDEGKPWRFTDGQARFLILWYAFEKLKLLKIRREKNVKADNFGFIDDYKHG